MDLVNFNAEQARKQARNRTISSVIRYTLLFTVGLVMLYPLIWLVGASFKPDRYRAYFCIARGVISSGTPIPLSRQYSAKTCRSRPYALIVLSASPHSTTR